MMNNPSFPRLSLLRLVAVGLLATVALSAAPHAPRLLYDQAHGESAPPVPLAAMARGIGLDLAISTLAIGEEGLKGADILYLRAPSKEFTAAG
jgi:hypothetical protein